MKIPARLEWLLLAVAVAACAPLPAEKPRPEATRPALRQTVDTALSDPAFSRGGMPKRTWWRMFGDAGLDALMDDALRGNPNLGAAEARVGRARQAARLVQLDTGVRLNGNASVTRQHLSENGLFPPPLGGSTFSEGDVSVAAAYTLDWWGRNRALLEAAIGERRAAQAERDAAELVLAAETADAYFAWEGVAARLNTARRGAEERRVAVSLANRRVERGIDAAFAARQLELQLAQDEADVRALEAQAAVLRDRLAALAGAGPDWGAALAEPKPGIGEAFPLPASLPLDILARRPDLVALKLHAEVAASRISAARADFYPNVDLNLLLGLQSLDLGTWLAAKSWYGSAGPAVHLPMFNRNTLRANLGAREAEYAEAVARYDQGLVTAAGQVGDALARLTSLAAQERAQREGVAVAERTLRLRRSRFDSGLSDRLPVLDQEIATLVQRARVTTLQAERKRAMVSLFQALGGGFDGNEER